MKTPRKQEEEKK